MVAAVLRACENCTVCCDQDAVSISVYTNHLSLPAMLQRQAECRRRCVPEISIFGRYCPVEWAEVWGKKVAQHAVVMRAV